MTSPDGREPSPENNLVPDVDPAQGSERLAVPVLGDVVRGVVADAAGQPLDGVRVWLTVRPDRAASPGRSPRALHESPPTGTDGAFLMAGISRSQLYLHAERPGSLRYCDRLSFSGRGEVRECRIVLTMPGAIAGQVLATNTAQAGPFEVCLTRVATGRPLVSEPAASPAEARSLEPVDRQDASAGTLLESMISVVRTDGAGAFRVEGLREGTYRLEVTQLEPWQKVLPAADGAGSGGQSVDFFGTTSVGVASMEAFVAGGRTTTLSLRVAPDPATGCRITGRLVGTLSGQRYVVKWSTRPGVVAAPDGSFDLGVVAPGAGTLLASVAQECEVELGATTPLIEREIQVAAGGSVDERIELPPHGPLRVLVVAAESSLPIPGAYLGLHMLDGGPDNHLALRVRSATTLVARSGRLRMVATAEGRCLDARTIEVTAGGQVPEQVFTLPLCRDWEATVLSTTGEPLAGATIAVSRLVGVNVDSTYWIVQPDDEGVAKIPRLPQGVHPAVVDWRGKTFDTDLDLTQRGAPTVIVALRER